MSVALRARQPPSRPHHGKFIYLYSNLKTNQVIYSLERELHTEKQERVLLKQLPFYGKKTVPTKLRKDLWRPFATVTFPDAADGLHAFKLLKEYRMVRDHAWACAAPTASAAASPITNNASWPSKKDRARLLMDQRATSVADLSHIIARQMSPAAVPAKDRSAETQRAKLWSKIQALAATPAADVKKLEDERDTLQSAAAEIPTHRQQGHADKTRQKKRQQRIADIAAQLNRLRKAREAVTFATGGDVDESLRAKWSKTLKYIVQMQDPSRPVLSTYDPSITQAQKEAAQKARPTNWPRSTKYDGGAAPPKMLNKRDEIALRHAAPEVDTRLAKDLPASSILIQWANLPDAQFARTWDANVVHEEMENKYVSKAERAHARLLALEAEAEAAWEQAGEGGEGQQQQRARLGERYKQKGRAVGLEEGEKAGWLASLNPMRLFRGEARA